ncbi:uncharacterized protein LOC119691167 [Plutella xylostella]|uniref:uncharacterized protein LOC119691167 n=1 Tax=Plutella xylostella TaxID=51655 RepID=UPI0020329A09|nr:uncharacterized protein LOC119691167 [Plutella xylostella]
MSVSDKELPQAIQQPEILRVGVKIPPFWSEEPALWFAQVESQFVLSRITTDDTKFCYLVAQLDHQYAAEVKDVITNPPEKDKYLKLKTELIKRLSASKEKRVKQLLMHEELGDRKPSQFLRHLESLAGPDVPKDFLSTIWSSRLPHNIQTVVASQSELALEKLAELADKVHEIAPSSPQVASTSSAPPTAYDDLTRQISELTRQVAMLTSKVNDRSYDREHPYSNRRRFSRSRSRSRSRPRQPPANHPHCFYHFTYGDKAQKCKEPCSFHKDTSENCPGRRK